MKSLLTFLLAVTAYVVAAQTPYWQQHLRYSITAELNDSEKSITGFETLTYRNNSPDTLTFIWFHLWPNAYRSDSTALFQQISNDEERKKKKERSGRGLIQGLSFAVNGQKATVEPHTNPQYVDITKVILPSPLLPGDSAIITTPFKVFLPPYFSRSGYDGTEFIACQWYPKPAVYDDQGWHEFPYLDMGEFYSEFGDFEVSLTVPATYIVGATGTMTSTSELEQYRKIGAANAANRKGRPVLYVPAEKNTKKTLTYAAHRVPDFAWFADKDFVVQYDTVRLSSGRIVDAFSYYHNQKKTPWVNSIDYVEDAVRKYSAWVGEYEYPTAQAVEGPSNSSSGGMEYPMITLITSPKAEVEELDAVITHEVGHNWFMSMLGNNERRYTWMDEGLNTYYQFRYEAEKYRYNSIFGKAIPEDVRKLPSDQFLQAVYSVIHQNLPMQSAMDIPADQFPNSQEYGLVSYVKTALWLYMLESSVGRDKLDLAMQNYFKQWKFRHPGPEDLQAAFEETLGIELDEYFSLTKKEGKF